MSLRELRQNADVDGDGTIGGVSDDGNDANNPSLNFGSLKATYSSSAATISARGSVLTAAYAEQVGVSVTSAGGAARTGLLMQAWPNPTQALVSAFDWNQTPSFVSWVHQLYWPDQTSGDMLFVGQTAGAFKFTGKITVATDGDYTFALDIDDDAKLLIDGAPVLSSDGAGICRRISGSATLTAGTHDFELSYVDNGASSCLMAWWQKPGDGALSMIPPTAFTWSPTERLPGLVSTTTISFSGTGTVSTSCGTVGWNGSNGPYSAGLQIANEGDVASLATGSNTITGYNGATVNGDAFVGVGGNATTDMYFNSSASVTGTRAARTIQLAQPLHRVPPFIPAASSGALSTWGNNTVTVNSSRRYDSISMSNNSTVVISGDVTLYVTGSVSMSNSSLIDVPTGSILRLYVGGALNVNNSAKINQSQYTGRCYIYMLGSGQNFGLTNSAQIHGHVRNPLGPAGFSSDSTASIFSGTLWCRQFQASNSATVRLDCGPLGGGGGGGGSGGVSITSYTEP
ncbi:MAG: PA14 domain-containing protein [Phycisphaerales bacterium]